MKTLVNLLIIVFSLLGMIDAGFISYEKFLGVVPPCSSGFQCETVLNSPWSMIGPVPLSVIGFMFYTLFFVLGIASYMGIHSLSVGSNKVSLSLLLATQGLVGFGFSLYLISVMGFVIQSWCLYCLLSAINCCILLVLSNVWHFKLNR